MDTVEISEKFDKMFEKAKNDFMNNYIDYSIKDGSEALMYFMSWSTFAQDILFSMRECAVNE